MKATSWILALVLAAGLGQAARAEPERLSDIAYGTHDRQRFDVYKPAQPRAAPVILMVHGGGWAHGDKRHGRSVKNKSRHFLAKGFVFISTNYRLLPDADPLEQADDIAAALAFAQSRAADWGGDPAKFILMGHSAGGHLVSLLAADPSRAARKGAGPVLGVVSLDSAGYDIPKMMKGRHMRLYDEAFGTDPEFWTAASPMDQLRRGAPPMLLVCSSKRLLACPEAKRFAAAAVAEGTRAAVIEQPLSHAEINDALGLPGDYTEAADAFIATLLTPR